MSKWGGHSKSSASHSRVVPLLHSPVLEWTAAVLSLCPRCQMLHSISAAHQPQTVESFMVS